MTGDDLQDFVNGKLFPYLHKFKDRASGANTIEYKIGETGEIKNKIQSGYNLRGIDHVDEMRFGSQVEKHELSSLYEEKVKRMGNAGRNGGEVLHASPVDSGHGQGPGGAQMRKKIYDGVCGSAEASCARRSITVGQEADHEELKTLQGEDIFEKKVAGSYRWRS
ncbi:MAG: hypothetical protein U0903_01740 [Planctomycetales bacterium]